MPQVSALRSAIKDLVGEAALVPESALAAYAVDGLLPSAVVFPSTPDQLAALLGLASREGLAVAPHGGGTKLGIGGIPRRLDLVIGTTRLDRVLEYEPADLTITVQAGITLDTLQQYLGRQGQFLPLDPPLPERATIGGILATNASGPLRYYYGTARDLLLGIGLVQASGVPIKSGGRVVKNVTGYDLSKLSLGALGTLGVIANATFKVSPLPPARATLLVAFDDQDGAVAASREIVAPPLEPYTCELLAANAVGRVPSLKAMKLPNKANLLAMQFAGAKAAVIRQMAEATQRAGEHSALAVIPVTEPAQQKALWRDLCNFGHDVDAAPLVVKLSLLPAELSSALTAVAAAASNALVLAPVARAGGTVLYVYGWPAEGDLSIPAVQAALASLEAAIGPLSATMVVERCPLLIKQQFAVWGPPRRDFPLMQRIKQHFDPGALLNPGRFVGGL